jgi:hypothetical protein
VNRLQWIIAAVLAAVACQLAMQHATPIDRALPFLAVIVTLAAFASYPAVMIGVPLLVLAEIAVFDFGLRYLCFGVIVAAAVAGCGLRGRRAVTPALAIAAIVLLRWIPLADVRIGRELFLLALCAAIVFVLGRTPFAVMIAVVTAIITPAVPLRTLAIPLLVLGITIAARAFGMPRLKLVWPSTAIVAFALVFFAWSGLVARAFPFFLQRETSLPRHEVTMALKPRESLTLDVPENARSLIVSGANVAHLRRGAALGSIEPGAIAIRIGDAADWGAFRREHAYGARNPLPRDPAGRVRGFGYSTWIDGAGRIALPPHARTIHVTAAASLPPNATLQVEGFE